MPIFQKRSKMNPTSFGFKSSRGEEIDEARCETKNLGPGFGQGEREKGDLLCAGRGIGGWTGGENGVIEVDTGVMPSSSAWPRSGWGQMAYGDRVYQKTWRGMRRAAIPGGGLMDAI